LGSDLNRGPRADRADRHCDIRAENLSLGMPLADQTVVVIVFPRNRDWLLMVVPIGRALRIRLSMAAAVVVVGLGMIVGRSVRV
jgi:hypothetical protein